MWPLGCCRNPRSSWTRSCGCHPAYPPQHQHYATSFCTERDASELSSILASFTLWSTMSYTSDLRSHVRANKRRRMSVCRHVGMYQARSGAAPPSALKEKRVTRQMAVGRRRACLEEVPKAELWPLSVALMSFAQALPSFAQQFSFSNVFLVTAMSRAQCRSLMVSECNS